MNVKQFLEALTEAITTINKLKLEKALVKGQEFKIDPFNEGQELLDIMQRKVEDMVFQNGAQSQMEEQDLYTLPQILEVEEWVKDLKSIGDLEDLPISHEFWARCLPEFVVEDWKDSTEIWVEILEEEVEEAIEWRR